jgi:hypothetical protein
MKKQILLLALIAATALLFSCNKKNERSESNRGEDYEAPPRASTKESYSFSDGYALTVTASLYTIKKDTIDTGDVSTEVVWASYLGLGEKVKVGRPRKLTIMSDKKKNEWDFVEIQLNDKNKTKGFALDNQIAAGNGYLAVVIDDKALLYSAANVAKPTNTVISKKTIVVYYLDSESNGFVEVKGWDGDTTKKSNRLIPDNRYMRLSSISKDEADIQSSILLQTALFMKDDKQALARETLLKTALQEYPGSFFSDEIRTLLNNPNSANNEGYF